MKKILLVSDNHGKFRRLNDVIFKHLDVDLKVHCGDSEFERETLKDWIAVRGNNDFTPGYPAYEVISDYEGHNILVIHGDGYVFMDNRDILADMAEDFNADIVFFGHTHVFEHTIIRGIHLINPGSLNYNRDRSNPSYAIVTLNKNDIKVERFDVER